MKGPISQWTSAEKATVGTPHKAPAHEFVRFGIFELDLRSSELRRKGVKVKLQQQPFEILRLLVAHPGQFVSRESIQKTLWPDNYFVDFEGSINTAMMKLRRALREDANSPTYIETVARNGYRWIAPIIGESPAQSKGIRAIAILPLQDLSGIPDSEYFVDGLTDALITEMAQRSELHVVSRMTTVRYKHSQQSMQQIAKELNVQAVVEGSILRSGDRIRVSARLLDAIEDRHLWAQTYDRNLQDILILQQDVVTAIVTSAALALKRDTVSAAPRQINPKAYESLLKGNFLFSLRAITSLSKAIECYQNAAALEPAWAPPFAMIAECSRILDMFRHASSSEILARATTLTEKALRLDPENPQAHATMGAVWAMHEWRWKEGEQRIQFALRADPQSSQIEFLYSIVLLFQGKYDEALRHIDRALSIDPSSLFLRSQRAQILLFARRFAECIQESEDLLEQSPDFAMGLMNYGAALLDSGKPAEAIPALQRAFAKTPLPTALMALVKAHCDIGQPDAATANLNRLHQMHRDGCCSPTVLAVGHLSVGQVESAFEWLEVAYSELDSYLPILTQLPLVDKIRQDSRFVRLRPTPAS
jgi:TolB-like protein/Tfp pilus assembly protein PilF